MMTQANDPFFVSGDAPSAVSRPQVAAAPHQRQHQRQSQRPRRVRVDGWTDRRRSAFLDALGHCGSLDKAARAVGLTRMSVWRLRQRDAAFNEACSVRQRDGVDFMSDLLIERALMGNPLEGGVSNRMLMFLMSRYGYQHHSPERGPRFAGREGPGEKRATSEAARAWRKVQAEAYSLRADRVMDAIEEALEAGDEAELEAAIRCPGGISDAFMLVPCPPVAPEERAQEKVPETLQENALDKPQAKRQPDALTRFLTGEDAREESGNAPNAEQRKGDVHAPAAPASGEMNKDTNTRITMGPVRGPVRGPMPEPEPTQETIQDAPPKLGPTHPPKQHRSEEKPP